MLWLFKTAIALACENSRFAKRHQRWRARRNGCFRRLRSHMLSKCLYGETMASYHRKDDRSRRGTLLAERKFMKRWRSGRLNPYTPNNVSTCKRVLKWHTGNRYRDVTWPKYWLSQFISGINGPSVWSIEVIRCPCIKCIKSCASLFKWYSKDRIDLSLGRIS